MLHYFFVYWCKVVYDNPIETAILIITTIGVVFAFVSIRDIRRQKRIEFAYQQYRDFFNYLNTPENKDLRSWLFGEEIVIEDKNRIGDLLEQFECVANYYRRNLIDEHMVYTLFAFYVLKVFAAKNPTAFEYIESVRMEEKEVVYAVDTIFAGIIWLRDEVEKIQRKNKYEF